MATLTEKRPLPGDPSPYSFPKFSRTRLENGLTVIGVEVPGRPLATGMLLFEAGSENEPAKHGGVAALAGRALTEGTAKLEAIEFIEAVEKLGADITGSADWDYLAVTLRVPVTRLEPALELLAEAVRNPVFPEREVERLKQERLNRIMQEYADPTLRSAIALDAQIYTPDSPYSRPAAGAYETVSTLDREAVEAFYRTFATPGSATLIVAGDIQGIPLAKVAENLLGDWTATEPKRSRPKTEEAISETQVLLVDRPGSVQSNLAVGYQGVPRRIDDYPQLALVNAATGGLFNSRLNMRLREEKGFTYGAFTQFHFRREKGPFWASSAVQTAVTKEAISDMVEVLRGIHDEGITEQELDDARDFLVGVFPLRFETPEGIAQALAQLVIHDLPDDFYDTYRPALQAVSLDDAKQTAARRLRSDPLAIVVVGDASKVAEPLEQAGLGPVEVVEDAPPGGS